MDSILVCATLENFHVWSMSQPDSPGKVQCSFVVMVSGPILMAVSQDIIKSCPQRHADHVDGSHKVNIVNSLRQHKQIHEVSCCSQA